MQKSDPSELIKHGLHLGHKSQKLHPKSKIFVYQIDRGTAIIDLFQTAIKLDAALEYVFKLGTEKKNILFVGTKKQARLIISEICQKYGIDYVTNKWIAGLLTNYSEISKNIKKLIEMNEAKQKDEWNNIIKHERVQLEKKLHKIDNLYHGIMNMNKLPDALFIFDIKNESNAVLEAHRMQIPIIAVVDTNCNPDLVNYPIPANDDAISSISYLTESIASAYNDGKKKSN